MENIFQINEDTCNRDGLCKEVCPVNVIDFSKDGFPVPFADAEEVCIRCGHCVAVCPTGSFRHRDLDREAYLPLQPGLQPALEQVEHFLQSRRSIRVYKKKPVAPELLQKLIEMAAWAPSAHNAQKVRWLVFSGSEKLRRLAGITADWMRWVMDVMPERAAEMHLERRVKRWEEGVDGILRDAPALIVAYGEKYEPVLPAGSVPELDHLAAPLDYAIALTHVELAAVCLGLGACWAGYLYRAANTFRAMHDALELPEGHQCFGALMVGYSKFTYRRIPPRNAPVIAWR